MQFWCRAAGRPFFWSASALALATIGFQSVAAQETQVPGQTREEIDQARQAPPLEARPIDSASLAAPGPCPLTGRGTVRLTRIEIQGASLVSQDVLDEAVSGLVGTERDLAVLCEARDRVMRVYADHGEALVRVDLPEQRVSGGVLTLRVTEGRIVATTVQNEQNLGPAAALARRYLKELESGGATSWSDVERAFLLTQEIPGAEANFSIRRAADGGPDGLAAVAALRPRRKLDLSLSGQNFGSKEVGREGVSLRVDANSFTALGERTSLVLFTSLEGNQRVLQLLEEFRIGPSGLTVLGDIAYGETEPAGALAPLELEGRSLVGRIGARYPVTRTRAHSLDAGGRFEWVDQKNDLGAFRGPGGDPMPLFEERLRVLSVDVGGRWQPNQLPGLSSSLAVELRKGLAAFGASRNGDPLLSRAEGRPDFSSIRFQTATRYSFNQSRAVRPYVSGAASGQWASDPLPAYEEFQVGNYTVGRGYDPGAASGDSALGVQLEAGLDFLIPPGLLSLFGFVDAAHLWNEDSFGYDSDPWSIGAGARAQVPFGQLSLVYAAPQEEPFPSAGKPADRLLLTVSTRFSIR